MSRRGPVYCCHACDTVFRESESEAVLHCYACGETFGGQVHGEVGGIMKAQQHRSGDEVPSADDNGQCPLCGGRLEGGVGCPNCGAGGDYIGEVESCMCGHTRGMALRTRRKPEPKGATNER